MSIDRHPGAMLGWFHIDDGIYIRRTHGTMVEIIKFVHNTPGSITQFQLTVPGSHWASAIASVAPQGGISSEQTAALDLHLGTK